MIYLIYREKKGGIMCMSTDAKKYYGTYKGYVVEGPGKALSEKRLKESLNIPAKNDDELSVWLCLAKMLAESRVDGIWGEEEDKALNWVREMSTVDRSFLKGDCAVWTFYNEFEMEKKLEFKPGGKPQRTKLSKKQQKKVTEKLYKGVPLRKIARDHDVTPNVIYRFIENYLPDYQRPKRKGTVYKPYKKSK